MANVFTVLLLVIGAVVGALNAYSKFTSHTLDKAELDAAVHAAAVEAAAAAAAAEAAATSAGAGLASKGGGQAVVDDEATLQQRQQQLHLHLQQQQKLAIQAEAELMLDILPASVARWLLPGVDKTTSGHEGAAAARQKGDNFGIDLGGLLDRYTRGGEGGGGGGGGVPSAAEVAAAAAAAAAAAVGAGNRAGLPYADFVLLVFSGDDTVALEKRDLLREIYAPYTSGIHVKAEEGPASVSADEEVDGGKGEGVDEGKGPGSRRVPATEGGMERGEDVVGERQEEEPVSREGGRPQEPRQDQRGLDAQGQHRQARSFGSHIKKGSSGSGSSTSLAREANYSFQVLFLVGHPAASEDGDLVGDVLYVQCPKGYRLIVEKTRNMMAVVKHVNFRFLLKSDDDTFVCPKQVARQMHGLPMELQKKAYGGIPTACGISENEGVGKVIKDPSHKWYDEKYSLHTLGSLDCYPPYMQGAFYLLAYPLVNFLYEGRSNLLTFTNEDVTVGSWLLGVDRHMLPFNTLEEARLWACSCSHSGFRREYDHNPFFHNCKTMIQLAQCRVSLPTC